MKTTLKFLILQLLFTLFLFKCYSQNQEDLGSDDMSRFNYAKNFYAAANYTQAITYCSNILSIRENADVFELRAKCYRAQGNYTEAIKDYTEAIQRKSSAALYQDRGMCNFCIENYEQANDDFTEAIRLSLIDDPNMATYNFLLYEARGRAYLRLGLYDNAITDLSIAAENGSNTAAVEILSPLLHNNMMDDIKNYTSRIIKQANSAVTITDSSIKNYVTALYMLTANNNAKEACSYIDNAVNEYKGFQKSCYKSLLNDLFYAKAVINKTVGNDSTAYAFYNKSYNSNGRQSDIKKEIEALKIKLGIDVTPPVITLVAPQQDSFKNNTINVTTGTLELYAKAQDSSGVSSVTVNNKSISKVEEDGMFVASLDLSPGMNNIMIEAMDKYENKAIKTIKVNLVAANDSSQQEDPASIPQLFTYANYYAVLIGEKDYTDASFQDLESPATDANDLKKILSTYYQFEPKHITTLINSSRTNILDTLTNIASSLKPDDNLIVFYAGHGTVKRVGNQIIGGYIIPSDAQKGSYASYIKSDDLKEAIESSEAKHILFVVDACFGGTLFRGTMDEASKSIQTAYKQKSRQMISSGNEEEVPDKGEFIRNLKDYLTKNTNNFLSCFDLFSYLKKNADLSSPQLNTIRDVGDSGGDFIFSKK